jgi:Fe-S cluster biogenesis protein NfuA
MIEQMSRTKQEIMDDINVQLEEKVAPMVALHGGVVKLIDFNEDTGIVTMMMSGSCSGCAGSSMTLKYGIENLLTHYVPEVTAVVGQDDPSMTQPFYPRFNFHHSSFGDDI